MIAFVAVYGGLGRALFDARNPRPLGIPVQQLLSLAAIGVTLVAVVTAIAAP
jgi:hypothetical protein